MAFADTTDAAAPIKVLDAIGAPPPLPEYRKELRFGGRRYELRLAPDAAYLHARTSWQSWSVLTGGLLLTALMGALMLVISGERTQIQAQVDDATARLREREARLQAILDNAADAIITVDRAGTVLSANPAAGALFGYPPDQLRGLRIGQLLEMPPGDGADALPRLAQGGAGAHELTGTTSAGARFPLSISASQVKLRDEDIFVCIIHDLTEQRRAQEHIYQLAHHDPLTGLENRFSLNLHLEQLLAAGAPRRPERGAAVPRPRPLQEDQRFARPPDRRPAAGRSGAAPARNCCATSTSSPASAATNSSS